MEKDWIGLPAGERRDWAGEWGVGPLRIVPGGRPRDWHAELCAATLARRERELTRRELRLTVMSYVLAASICLEVVLALVVMSWGNGRLSREVVRTPAAVGTRR